MDSKSPRVSFEPTKRVIVLIDLAGCAKAFQREGDEKMVAFLQDYYVACEGAVTRRGGTVIKFMGDACLAVFRMDDAKNALDALVELQSTTAKLATDYGVQVALGANVHLAAAIEAEFGIGSSKRKDILGRGVNQTFLLGRGVGIRISEPVYRALPSSARSPWKKHKPPAVYHLDTSDGIYEGLGKDPVTNSMRW